MQGFVYNGDTVIHVSYNEDNLKETLKPAIYTVEYNDMMGFFLKIDKERFASKKVFGNINRRANKVIKKYENSSKNVGVLLTGLKGSGKTLLATTIANTMIEKGFPVILINEQYRGQAFMKFMSSLGDCVILVDEFAKLYKDKENNVSLQDELLTLFDGTMNSRSLFVLTENEKSNIDQFFMNRPGRLHYHFEYERLDDDIQEEYLKEKFPETEKRKLIQKTLDTIPELSFDIMEAVVSDVLLFPEESIEDILKDLNIMTNGKDTFEYEVFFNDKKVSPELYTTHSYGLGTNTRHEVRFKEELPEEFNVLSDRWYEFTKYDFVTKDKNINTYYDDVGVTLKAKSLKDFDASADLLDRLMSSGILTV